MADDTVCPWEIGIPIKTNNPPQMACIKPGCDSSGCDKEPLAITQYNRAARPRTVSCIGPRAALRPTVQKMLSPAL